MKTISTLLLLITLLAITGCESETGPGNTPSTLIPLKEGNVWVYEHSKYDSLGTLLTRAYDTITIGKAVTIDGQVWYEKLRSGFNVPNDSASYSNQPDGIWSRYVIGGAYTKLLYKYPTAVNDTFNVTISQPFPVEGMLEKTFTMTVTPNEPVTIPLGTFNTVHYRSYLQSIDSVTKEVVWSGDPSDQYVAPGVGLVKSVYQSFIGFSGTLNTHESILIYYSLK